MEPTEPVDLAHITDEDTTTHPEDDDPQEQAGDFIEPDDDEGEAGEGESDAEGV